MPINHRVVREKHGSFEQFSSSRTFPGQWYEVSISIAGVEIRVIVLLLIFE